MGPKLFFTNKLCGEFFFFFSAIYCTSHEKDHQSPANSVFYRIVSGELSVWKHGIVNVLLSPANCHLYITLKLLSSDLLKAVR